MCVFGRTKQIDIKIYVYFPKVYTFPIYTGEAEGVARPELLRLWTEGGAPAGALLQGPRPDRTRGPGILLHTGNWPSSH